MHLCCNSFKNSFFIKIFLLLIFLQNNYRFLWVLGERNDPGHNTNNEDLDERIVLITSTLREKRSLDSSIQNVGELEVTLQDKEKKIHLHLVPNNKLLSPHYKLVIRGEEEVEEELRLPEPVNCIFIGSELGHPEHSAALSNCDGNGFSGVIVDDEATHFIQPLETNSIKRTKRGTDWSEDITSDGLHIVRSRNTASKCALKDLMAMSAPQVVKKLHINVTAGDPVYERLNSNLPSDDVHLLPNYQYKRKMAADVLDNIELIVRHDERYNNFLKRNTSKSSGFRRNEMYRIETSVFIDDEMYKRFRKERGPNAISHIEDYTLAIMNAVHLLYMAPSMKTRISITLVRLEIMKVPVRGLNKANGSIKSYLDNFCSWQAKKKRGMFPKGDISPGFWDHGLLLTDLDLWDLDETDTKVIGLAWVAGMCRPYFSCTINEGNTFEAIYVITHEIGHNLRMSHDGASDMNKCDPEKHIMSSSTGPGKVTWSHCSNRELEAFLEAEWLKLSCLSDIDRNPKVLDINPDDSLPGEIYSAEDQCRFAAGPGASPYIKRDHPYNNICHILWCQNGSYASQAHPALEGTPCNRGRGSCISGACMKRIKSIPASFPGDGENEIDTGRNDVRNDRRSFKSLFVNIKDFFKKYLFLEKGSGEVRKIPSAPTWILSHLTQCSSICGGGWQEGLVICVNEETRVILDDSECDQQRKPPAVTSCNTLPCLQ